MTLERIGLPRPRSPGRRGSGMPHGFQFAWRRRRSTFPGIAGPAQGLQATLAVDEKFRIGRPQFAATAACLFRPQFCIESHCIARTNRFPASSVGRILNSPDQGSDLSA
jgi:hypothetical protein